MLDDLLDRGLDLVVCGTSAGNRSARLHLWYADPRNRFWRTLADVGLTSRELSPADYQQLLAFRIGLTDLAKAQAGNDDRRRFAKADAIALRAKIILYQPRYFCFNGKRAAQEFLTFRKVGYGVHAERIGRTVLFVAPSTSGQASAWWDLSVWRDLAARVRGKKGRGIQASDAPAMTRGERSFTPLQGQYLSFIHLYTKLNRRPPAEADLQAYFRVTPPAVHSMILGLSARGLIVRVPGQARSIEVLLPPDELPELT